MRSSSRVAVACAFALLIPLADLLATQPASTVDPPNASRQASQAAAPEGSSAGKALYDQIKSFRLTGGAALVDRLVLTRDRVSMTFSGTFYFTAPADGRVTGAVFVGQGTMRAEPPTDFERGLVRRLLNADVVESDFRTAVLRWSDDTFDLIRGEPAGAAPSQATRLAADFEAQFLRETGVNVAARLAVSILNEDAPGVFLAQFDGGRRNRFTYALDYQSRIPADRFTLNAGEKGVIFQYQPAVDFSEVWLAFSALDDYARGSVTYSDAYDVVDVTHYALGLDVREVPQMTMTAGIESVVRGARVRAVSFNVGESLPSFEQRRLVNQLRLEHAAVDGRAVAWVQEDWEGGFTVFLPEPLAAGAPLPLSVRLKGRFLHSVPLIPEFYYPYNNVTWLPRHGYLDRATFDLTFRHRSRERIASIGTRVAEDADPDDRNVMIARYRMTQPVGAALFAVGPFERRTRDVTFEGGGATIPLEFHSVPANLLAKTNVNAVNHAFILDELNNSIRYFSALFGPYPYETYGATFHPFGFGQGFPSMLVIPPAGSVAGGRDSAIYSFLSHETAHQWWGHIVAWRSYRDQWLSEGFAEYSGLTYAARRDKDPVRTTSELVRLMRDSLREMPRTVTGGGKGRLNDIGPLSHGLRLNTTRTLGAYQALVYNKGALVLRMLHFLFSHPSSYDDAAFTAMMKDFVGRHRGGAARTEDFQAVASQHFARTPTAQKFGLRDLDWFFRQWVHGAGLPTYQLDWEFKTQPDGSTFVAGTVRQDNVDDDWQMVLPLVLTFDGGQEARTTVRVEGKSSPFELKVPARPRRVDLDPHQWVLSERTTSRGK